MKNYKLMLETAKGNTLLKEFKENINHVLIEYGKWAKHGIRHYSAEDWFLHYDSISEVAAAHIIILYKDGTFEEFDSGKEIKKKYVQDWLYDRYIFWKMFFVYLKTGLRNLGLLIRIKRIT